MDKRKTNSLSRIVDKRYFATESVVEADIVAAAMDLGRVDELYRAIAEYLFVVGHFVVCRVSLYDNLPLLDDIGDDTTTKYPSNSEDDVAIFGLVDIVAWLSVDEAEGPGGFTSISVYSYYLTDMGSTGAVMTTLAAEERAFEVDDVAGEDWFHRRQRWVIREFAAGSAHRTRPLYAMPGLGRVVDKFSHAIVHTARKLRPLDASKEVHRN